MAFRDANGKFITKQAHLAALAEQERIVALRALRKGAPAAAKLSVSRPAKRAPRAGHSGMGNMARHVSGNLPKGTHPAVIRKVIKRASASMDWTGSIPPVEDIVRWSKEV